MNFALCINVCHIMGLILENLHEIVNLYEAVTWLIPKIDSA